MAGGSDCAVIVLLTLLCTAASQILAPFDADEGCLVLNNTITTASSGTAVLLDSHHYLSLDGLWFADDESIDLFAFPLPVDPVRWELIDQSQCRNVWQYCGQSSADILISQFITGVRNSSGEVVVSVEYAFFTQEPSVNLCSEEATGNVLIVEVDDTTGLDNVHNETISPCLANQSSFRHDFTYTPMNQYFELVFRSNLSSSSACINVSRVRVFYCNANHHPVQDTYSSIITCLACPTGHYLERGECVPCPDFSSSAGGNDCMCDLGHQRSTPGNYSLPCDQCASGYFGSENGSCMPCPLPGFSNNVSTALDTACRCYNDTLSSNLTCQFCAANYMRSSSAAECVLCPAGSRRGLVLGDAGNPVPESEGSCTCLEGGSTSSGQNITSYESCDNCSELSFWNGSQCIFCPANSQLPALEDSLQCTCDPNTLTVAGRNETTTEQCFCVDGFYRLPGSTECWQCPLNSFRSLSDPEHSCPCLEGLRRENASEFLGCFAYVGFEGSSLLLMEGEGEQANNITVVLSQISAVPVYVSIDLAVDRNLSAQVRPNNASLANVERLDFTLSFLGNIVSLEEDASLNLSLAVREEGGLLIGGPGSFGELKVIIREDDLLYVGFTENVLVFEASERVGSIRVNLSTSIGRELVILIRVNDTLSSNLQASRLQELRFLPTDATSKLFEFDIDQGVASYVLISLEVATYPESLNSVRDRITVGVFPGLYREATLRQGATGSGRALSSSVLTGLVCSVVVVCFNATVVLCLVCICYKKEVLKRGRKSKPHNGQRSQEEQMADISETVEMEKLKALDKD